MPARGTRIVLAAFFALALLSGPLTACQHGARQAARQPTAAPVAVETRVGTVRAIGTEQRFVLVETFSALAASALPEGQLLHSRPPDALTHVSTADLRVSREHHESLVVANVVAGQPTAGDIVYFRPTSAAATPTPTPGPISDVPAALLPALFGPRNP